MKKHQLFVFVVLVLSGGLGSLSGCALLTKSPPITPRYFEPESQLPTDKNLAPSAPSEERRLRLGRVESGPHLRERMIYRTSEQEVGYYEDRRWTERPSAYVRRALSYSLFEQHGVTRVVSGAAPTLDAELIAFEEIQGSEHEVRVGIVVTLDDATGGAIEQTVMVEESVAEGDDENDAARVVRAFSSALSRAVEQVSQVVLRQLDQISAASPEPNTSENFSTTSAP